MQGVGGPRPPRLWDWAQRDRWEPQGQMLCGWMCGSLLSYVGKERRRQREKTTESDHQGSLPFHLQRPFPS